mmetsp:Transcript_25157/g.45529  ORF Transcript_25157/g.45529 Transcript_25157/m.45529 type:complete len:156 (-) Transcript_25157:107-574(-)
MYNLSGLGKMYAVHVSASAYCCSPSCLDWRKRSLRPATERAGPSMSTLRLPSEPLLDAIAVEAMAARQHFWSTEQVDASLTNDTGLTFLQTKDCVQDLFDFTVVLAHQASNTIDERQRVPFCIRNLVWISLWKAAQRFCSSHAHGLVEIIQCNGN